MTSVSAAHIILTPTQPVGSGRSQQESNPTPSHQELRALPIELQITIHTKNNPLQNGNLWTNMTSMSPWECLMPASRPLPTVTTSTPGHECKSSYHQQATKSS